MALHHSGFSFTKRNYCRKKREHIRNSWFVDLHVQQTTDMRTSGVHPPSPDAELLELRAGFSFPFCLVDLFYFCVLYVATYFCVYISICLPLFFYLYRNLYLQNLLVPNFCWFLKCNYFTLLQRKTAVSGKKTFAPPPTKMRTYRKTREDLQVIPGIEDSNFDRRPFPGKTRVLHPK